MENVIAPFELTGPFECKHIEWFLYHANCPIAVGVRADRAWVRLGGVETYGTEAHPLLDVENCLGKRDCLVTRGAKKIVREPRCGLGADPRQLRKLVDQTGDRLGGSGTMDKRHRCEYL